MSSSAVASSFSPPTSFDSETAALVPDSSLSSQVSPKQDSPEPSSSSQLQQQPPKRYSFIAAAAETKDHLIEKLLDNTDSNQQPYTRFDVEKEPQHRLPKVKVLQTKNKEPPKKMPTSFEDITSLRLWKGIVAEFVGTLLLTLVGCGSCINLRGADNATSPVVQIALCFGLSVGTIVWSIGHISGGHINPAVTVAVFAARKISLAKAVFFILFQLIGAVIGAGILFGLTPESYHGNLGMTMVNSKINLGQAVGIEFFVTLVLVFAVFASCDAKRKDLNGSTPLSIGLAVTMCHLWAIDFTGSSMNTARSFGPALVMGEWQDHWVYWLGPILGGLVAGLLYEHLFAVNASLLKAKACLLSSDYDDDKYKAHKMKIRIIEEDSINDENDEFPLTKKDDKYTSNV
uniref:Aquaporin n=1 Tax=Arion vulgaris TaxID=1028688 RepID=A0A0B6ZX72_9EUPU